MKTFQRWMGILLVAIAAAGLAVACGDTAEDTSCIADGDCGTGQVCNFATETCAYSCTGDGTVCIEGEECQARGAGNTGSICVVTGDTTPTDECTSDSECDEANGETCDLSTNTCVGGTAPECSSTEECGVDEICNADGVCETTAKETYYFVKVADASTTCDSSIGDPGSDLFSIELRKGAGGETYHATAVSWNNIDAATNENADFAGILDGAAPEFSGTCPEFSASNVVSLGCGGDVVVEFLDDSGNRIEIEDGDAIVPFEWGAQCDSDSGSTTDAWEVLLCDPTVARGDIAFESSACNGSTVSGGQGQTPVTVTLP